MVVNFGKIVRRDYDGKNFDFLRGFCRRLAKINRSKKYRKTGDLRKIQNPRDKFFKEEQSRDGSKCQERRTSTRSHRKAYRTVKSRSGGHHS